MIGIDAILKGVFGDRGLVGGVVDTLKTTGVIKDPEMELKIMQSLQDFEIKLREFAAKEIESVNATMREEAKSEHWIQYSWRPSIGFTFIAVILNNYILLPYAKALGLGVQVLDIPVEIWSAMLVILGVAAGTRGLQKWQKEKNNGT